MEGALLSREVTAGKLPRAQTLPNRTNSYRYHSANYSAKHGVDDYKAKISAGGVLLSGCCEYVIIIFFFFFFLGRQVISSYGSS